MTTYLIRASHANQYELQNYEPIIKQCNLKLITSLHPLTNTRVPTINLWSPTDLPSFPLRRQVMNRLIGGEQWLLGLAKIVKPSDILHTAETYTPYTHQAVQLRKNGSINRLICTCWETIPHNNEKFSRLKQWKKEAYRYVDVFHTPTQRAKQALITEGVNPNKIKVIPYGVNLQDYAPSRLVYRSKTKPVILTVARPVKEKGLEIYARVKRELQSIADFRWVSGLPYHSMPHIYRSADIFFLPSLKTDTWEEQYGMVLVEAMAAGLPIVTSNSGAIPEVLAGAALITNLSDPTGHINNLLTLIKEPKKYQLYATRSIRRSKLFNINLVASQLASLYKS